MAITTAYQFQADLKGLERLQKEIIKARTELKKLTKDTDEYKRKTAEIKTLGKQFDTIKGSMGKATIEANNLNKAGGKLINTFKSAAVAIASAFAVRAIVGGLKNIVTAFTEFEAQLAAVKAISGATNDEFLELERTARKFGATTIFTATQVGKLQEEFARLGFSVDEINAATQATLQLSAATGESLAKSAQVAGTTLRAFGKSAVQTKNVVDVMAASFTSSALNLDKFTESMKFVAPVARTTGFTLEETTALLAQLADNGISGSIAGNALKNVFLRLGDSSSKLSKRLGGAVTGLPELITAMEQLKEEGFGATEAIELLDKRSAPAFLALMQNINGLQDSVEILNDAEDAASKMSQIRLDTLEGDMTILKSAAEGLSIALGDEFDVIIRNIVTSLTSFLQGITNSDVALSAIKETIKLLSRVLAVLAVRFAAIGFSRVLTSVKALAVSMRGLTAGVTSASLSVRALGTAFKSLGMVNIITAVATLVATFATFRKEMTETEMQQRRLNDAIRDELDAIIELEEGTSERARAMRQFKGEFGGMLELIDIELASQEDLIELRDLSITQEEKKLKMAQNDAEIKKLKQEIVLNREKANEARKNLNVQKDLSNINFGGGLKDGTTEEDTQAAINASRFRIVNAQNERRSKLKILEQQNKDIEKSLALELQQTRVYQNLKLNGDETYRQKVKANLDKVLIEFRKLEKEQQDAIILERQQELFEKSALLKYFDMVAAKKSLYGEDLEQMEENIKSFVDKTKESQNGLEGFDIEANKAGVDVNKLGVEVSLLDNFFNDLSASLKTGTKDLKEFVNTGFKLNKTKDLLKELNKSIVKTVFDRIEQRKAAINQEYDTELDGLIRQKNLAETNQQTVLTALKSDNAEILAQTVLNNQSKFDNLKNLNVRELEILKEGGDAAKDLAIRLLEETFDIENDKLERNEKIRANILKTRNNGLQEIQDEETYIVEQGLTQRAALEQRFGDFGIKGAFKRVKLKMSILKQESDQAIQDKIREFNRINQLEFDITANFKEELQKRLIAGEIFSDAQIRNAQDLANTIDQINRTTTQNTMEVLADEISMYGDFFQQAFTAFNTWASNMLAQERQAVNERYDAEREDRQTAFEAELEALGDNEAAKENLRKLHIQREEDMEEKKQQELRKIAKKEFQIQKANDLVQAAINGALAIIKVISQTGVIAPAVLPITAGLVAAQIAAIASQKFVGQDGGMIPEFAKGGMVHGPSHAQGGVKFNAGGRVVELEGGEAVITKKATQMFKPQLSAMNQAGGGIAFADGGITPGTSGMLQSTSVSQSQQFSELAKNIVSGINTKEVILTESSVTQSQSNVELVEVSSALF
tara:strand:- start:1460 stop:5488 length:4029 start_codon:yes stop_codon:yes gene_type:complete